MDDLLQRSIEPCKKALADAQIDTSKIDRAFARDLTARGDNSRLTEAIIAMGKTLSLTVVAQGIETKEQAEFLREQACDEFQGFYFKKPMPASQLTELLLAQSAAGARRAS